jgi:hypothetical protein
MRARALQHLEFRIKSGDRKNKSKRPVIPNEREVPGVTEIAARTDEPGVGRKRCARLKLKVPAIVDQPTRTRLNLRSGRTQSCEPRRRRAATAERVYNQFTRDIALVGTDSADLRQHSSLPEEADNPYTAANLSMLLFEHSLHQRPFDQRPADPKIHKFFVARLRVSANLAIKVQFARSSVE